MRGLALACFVVLATALAGCTTPAMVQKASGSAESDARSFKAKSDRAKVYFVNGKIVGNLFGMSHRYPSDLFIDGVNVGSMNYEDVMVFDLKPGEYRFSWNVRSTDMIDKRTEPVPSVIRVGAGDAVVLMTEYDQGGGAMFGLIGALVAPPKAQIRRGEPSDIKDKQFVVPQSCAPSLCLKD